MLILPYMFHWIPKGKPGSQRNRSPGDFPSACHVWLAQTVNCRSLILAPGRSMHRHFGSFLAVKGWKKYWAWKTSFFLIPDHCLLAINVWCTPLTKSPLLQFKSQVLPVTSVPFLIKARNPYFDRKSAPQLWTGLLKTCHYRHIHHKSNHE